MYFADTNLLEFNQYQKYNKALFIIKALFIYYDLYLQRYTLLLAGVFETLTNMCVKICELDPAKCL